MGKEIRQESIEECNINTDAIQQVISDLQIDEPLAHAMNRWKETLFQRNFSDNFNIYFRRVSAFNGYHAGDANARGYENDAIGQLCGAIGKLKHNMAIAKRESCELNEDEMTRTKNNFHKAAEMRGKSAEKYEKYSEHLGSLHRNEQAQIVLLAENVPSIIQVIQNVENRILIRKNP